MVTENLRLACASFCAFQTPTFGLLQLFPLRVYDIMPLCHFQSSFDVFAHCWSPLPTCSASGLQLPARLGGGTICDFPCLPLHHIRGTSSRPTNQCPVTLPCLSVHAPVVLLLDSAWIGSSQAPSFYNSPSCLAAHVILWTILACIQHLHHVLRADHSHVHRHLRLKQQSVPVCKTGWAWNNFGLQVRRGLHGELPAKLSCSRAPLAVLA